MEVAQLTALLIAGWNMLYFLWGVFRGRKDICTNPEKNTSFPTSNVLPHDREPNYLCQTSSPSKHLEKAHFLRESSHNIIETQNRTDVLSHETPSDRESSIERSSSMKVGCSFVTTEILLVLGVKVW